MSDLPQVDPHSETWRAVRKFVEERLELNRNKVEAIGFPPAETEAARGAIQELKELLELAKPPVVVAIDDDLNQMGGMF